MNVLAINGSPWMNAGNTAMILHPFLEGLRREGAAVEVVYTKNLKINFCQAEAICQSNEPGHCFQDDEMAHLLGKLAKADLWVLATPVYACGMTAQLKNVLDRMLPLVSPTYEIRGGHTRLQRRPGIVDGKIAFVATCGLYERDNFDPLVAHVQAFSDSMGRPFAGALLRPHAGVLKPMLQRKDTVGNNFAAAELAGRQLTKSGRMEAEVLAAVGRELISQQDFVALANQAVDRLIKLAAESG